MAQRQVRRPLAVVTIGAALAVLMAGPASTFGLGVTGSDGALTQVTETTQAVVETTQQTAASTVTTVETTVQEAVQPVAAPVTTQVQSTAGTVTAAPKQTVSRATAPVQRKTSSTQAPRRHASQPATKPGAVRTQQLSVSAPVRVVTRKAEAVRARARTVTRRSSDASRPASADSAASAPECDSLSILGLLPGAGELQAILSLVCNAAVPILMPGRIGVAAAGGSSDSGGDVLGTSASGAAPRRARAASARGGVPTAVGGKSAGVSAAANGQPGAPLIAGRAGSAGTGWSGASADGADATTAAESLGTNAASAQRHHHGWFNGSSKGTQALIAILILNLAILAGIAMWRLAVRWVIPRFA